MKNIFLILAVILISLITSCEESSGRGNLRIYLDTVNQTKTIRPDDKSSNVVKYNVRGTGPNGKTFSKDSSSKSMTIDGLTMGTWSISASGYNSNSVEIIYGSKTFQFDNSSGTVHINMSTYSGSGACQIQISWDKNIANPKLETILKNGDDSDSETTEITDGKNTYTYSKSNLQSGEYLFSVQLFSDDTLVAGFVDIIQIVNSKTTSGEISLNPSSDSSADSDFYGKFSVEDYSSLPAVVEAQKEMIISYELDDKSESNVSFSWYFDGILQSSSSSTISVTPEAGDHTLNLILSDSYGMGSAYYEFSAEVVAKKGSAIATLELSKNTTKLSLASDSIIGSLPDNHFIVITPSRSSMQVFTIYKNTVSLSANLTYNATDMRFSWLPQVTDLYSDPLMNFFVVKVGDNTAHVLYFNRTTEKIEPAEWNENTLSFSGYVSFPPTFIDSISSVTLIPSGDYAGSIFIHDSGTRSQEMLGILTSASEIKSMGTSTLSASYKPYICSDGNGDLIGLVNSQNKLIFAKVQNGITTSSWYTHDDPSLGTVTDFKFLNSRYAVFLTSNKIKICEYYSQQKLWIQRTTADASYNSILVSSDGAYIYFIDSSGNLISYRSGLTDIFGIIYSQTVKNPLCRFALNSQDLIGLDEYGNLYIFNIAQEDSSI